MKKKCCRRCSELKDVSAFHRDSSSVDGFSYSCAACRNKAKKAQKKFAVMRKATEMPSDASEKPKVHRVPIEEEKPSNDEKNTKFAMSKSMDDMCKALSDKFGSHFNLSVRRDGFAHLQIHSSPINVSLKGESASEIMEKALQM